MRSFESVFCISTGCAIRNIACQKQNKLPEIRACGHATSNSEAGVRPQVEKTSICSSDFFSDLEAELNFNAINIPKDDLLLGDKNHTISPFWHKFILLHHHLYPKVARDFLSHRDDPDTPFGTLFIVEAQTARAVSSVSTIPDEEEVLFTVNSQFRVIKRVTGGAHQLLEHAMEVDLSQTEVYELRHVELQTGQVSQYLLLV